MFSNRELASVEEKREHVTFATCARLLENCVGSERQPCRQPNAPVAGVCAVSTCDCAESTGAVGAYKRCWIRSAGRATRIRIPEMWSVREILGIGAQLQT